MASSLLSGFAGGAIGGAVVKLYLDDGQYKAGLTEAEAKGRAATGTLGGAFNKLKVIGAAAFAALGVAAVQFLADSFAAALEAQAAQTELANSIENSSQVTEDATPVFNAQSEAIRRMTGADDEAITSSQAFLVQMGLTEDQVSKLTPLIVDLSTKLGVDMQTAAKAVGKAVNGNIGGLSRMGVVVDKTAAETDAFAATLDALGAVQGFAAAKAQDEPWVLLSSTFGEIQEQIGTALLPAIKELAAALVPLAEDIGPLLDDVFGGLAETFSMFASQVAVLNGDLSKLTDGFNAGLLGAVLKFIPGMEGMGQAIENANAAYQDYRKATGKATDATRTADQAVHSADVGFSDFTHSVHRQNQALKTWANDAKEAFTKFTGELDASRIKWEFSARSFARAVENMRKRAQILAKDMRGLSQEDWVPAKFREWLVTQGPEAIHGFMLENKKQQREVVGDWRASEHATDQARRSVDDVAGAIRDLGTMNAKATVTIEYKITGLTEQQLTSLPGLGSP